MSKLQQLEDLATRAIEAGKTAKTTKDKARYSDIARGALDQLRTLKEQAAQPPAPEVDGNVMVQSDVAGFSPRPEPTNSMADDIYNSGVYQFLRNNAEIPGGVLGSVVGGVAGIPLGPAGVVGGSILGGSVGSGGGSLLSDVAVGDDLDFAKAVEEAAISAGFDVAMLGLGKLGKAAWTAMRKSGKTAEQVVTELANNARNSGVDFPVGSPESLAMTQQTLQNSGATLLPTQTGNASRWETLKEGIARGGIISSGTIQQNTNRVADAARTELSRIMGQGELVMSPDVLGQSFFNVIGDAKKIIGSEYGAAKSAFLADAGRIRVDTSPLSRKLELFTESRRDELVGIALDKDTQKVVTDALAMLDNLPSGNAKVESLLLLEKNIMDAVDKVGDYSSTLYNKTAARELAQLSTEVRDTIAGIIRVADPEQGAKYAAAKNAYSSSINKLLPDINKGVLTRASKESFTALGSLLTNVTDVNATKSFIGSLEEAYAAARRTGTEGLPFATIGQAKTAIRQSYLENLLKVGDTGQLDPMKFKDLASRMEVPKEAAKLKAVLGESYLTTKRFLNLMQEAAFDGTSNVGQLALKQKEYGAAASVGGFLAGGGGGAVVAASAVLAVPMFWAKAATNPRTVNRLLNFQKAKFPNAAAYAVGLSNLVADIADGDDEVKQMLKEMGKEQLQGFTTNEDYTAEAM